MDDPHDLATFSAERIGAGERLSESIAQTAKPTSKFRLL
jgi:hypothetical protein